MYNDHYRSPYHSHNHSHHHHNHHSHHYHHRNSPSISSILHASGGSTAKITGGGQVTDWRNLKFSNLNSSSRTGGGGSTERINQHRGKDGIYRPKSIYSLATEIDLDSSSPSSTSSYHHTRTSSPLSSASSSRSSYNPRIVDLIYSNSSVPNSSSSARHRDHSLTRHSSDISSRSDFYTNFQDNLSRSKPSTTGNTTAYSSPYRFTNAYYAPKFRDRPLLSTLNLKFSKKPSLTTTSASASATTTSSSGTGGGSSSGSLIRNGINGSNSSIGSGGGGGGSKTGSTSSGYGSGKQKSSIGSCGGGGGGSGSSSHNNSVSSSTNNNTMGMVGSKCPPVGLNSGTGTTGGGLERNKFLIKFREHHEKIPISQLSLEHRRKSICWDIPYDSSRPIQHHQQQSQQPQQHAAPNIPEVIKENQQEESAPASASASASSSPQPPSPPLKPSSLARWKCSMNLSEEEAEKVEVKPEDNQQDKAFSTQICTEKRLIEPQIIIQQQNQQQQEVEECRKLKPLKSKDCAVVVVKKKKRKQEQQQQQQQVNNNRTTKPEMESSSTVAPSTSAPPTNVLHCTMIHIPYDEQFIEMKPPPPTPTTPTAAAIETKIEITDVDGNVTSSDGSVATPTTTTTPTAATTTTTAKPTNNRKQLKKSATSQLPIVANATTTTTTTSTTNLPNTVPSTPTIENVPSINKKAASNNNNKVRKSENLKLGKKMDQKEERPLATNSTAPEIKLEQHQKPKQSTDDVGSDNKKQKNLDQVPITTTAPSNDMSNIIKINKKEKSPLKLPIVQDQELIKNRLEKKILESSSTTTTTKTTATATAVKIDADTKSSKPNVKAKSKPTELLTIEIVDDNNRQPVTDAVHHPRSAPPSPTIKVAPATLTSTPSSATPASNKKTKFPFDNTTNDETHQSSKLSPTSSPTLSPTTKSGKKKSKQVEPPSPTTIPTTPTTAPSTTPTTVVEPLKTISSSSSPNGNTEINFNHLESNYDEQKQPEKSRKKPPQQQQPPKATTTKPPPATEVDRKAEIQEDEIQLTTTTTTATTATTAKLGKASKQPQQQQEQQQQQTSNFLAAKSETSPKNNNKKQQEEKCENKRQKQLEHQQQQQQRREEVEKTISTATETTTTTTTTKTNETTNEINKPKAKTPQNLSPPTTTPAAAVVEAKAKAAVGGAKAKSDKTAAAAAATLSPPPTSTKSPSIKLSKPKNLQNLSSTTITPAAVVAEAKSDSTAAATLSPPTSTKEVKIVAQPAAAAPPIESDQQDQEDQSSKAANNQITKLTQNSIIIDPFQKRSKHQKKIRFREYSIDDFKFLTVLGRGSFGKVMLAELIGFDCHFAIKCLKKHTVIEDDDVESIMIERKVLAYGTSHPFICKLFCTFQTESHLFFAMELCSGGDLMFHVQKEGKFSENKARFYASEILCALWFLHKRSIIYRDLKLDNVMIANDGHIRLVDFGMCVGKMYREEFLPSNFCGTPEYMAPEIIKGVKYNHSVDYWALGVVIYEMCVGTSPFHGTDEDELLWNVCNTDVHYPKFLSEQVKTLCVLLLKKNPVERLGLPTSPYGDIVTQPWFHGIQWDMVEKCKLKPPFIPQLAHDADVSYFDQYFTKETPGITPCDKKLQENDQLLFQGFNYTNHRMTD